MSNEQAAPTPDHMGHPTPLHAAITSVRYWLDHGVKPSGGIARDVRIVLDELDHRMDGTEDDGDELIPNGMHYFFPNGDHVTDVARWAEDGLPNHFSTLDLRVLAAHLTTALDGVTAELQRRAK